VGNGGPTDARSIAEYDVARDLFSRGQLREALGKVEESLELDDGNAEAAYLGSVIMLAFCARDAGSSDCRFDAAEAYARKALDANPEMRDAKNTLGVILVHQRRYDEAIAVLKPLAEDIFYGAPQNSWGNLGWAYLEKGQVDLAIDALRRAVAAQPNFCVGHYRLGLAFEKKGELQAAREALSSAVEVERPECQNLQDAWEARARVALRLGASDDARSDFQHCAEIAPSTPIGRRCAASRGAIPAGGAAPSTDAASPPSPGESTSAGGGEAAPPSSGAPAGGADTSPDAP
jgi:Tfp pilus assembly protein PilF